MEMHAYQCTKCGELHHPRHYVCRRCGATEFEEVPLEGEGTVLTWTKAYNLPEGYMKPYMCFAIVEFDDTGLTVSGQINSERPEVGQRVKANVDIVKEGVGRDYYGFIFEPLE